MSRTPDSFAIASGILWVLALASVAVTLVQGPTIMSGLLLGLAAGLLTIVGLIVTIAGLVRLPEALSCKYVLGAHLGTCGLLYYLAAFTDQFGMGSPV